ncbi:MAG: LytTR family DNA-binding domain-containing protein [Bacteroidia bacterium]|nr:LytTR family DNA-binding domain-containing protein [Bacteroidia bacterium]
MVKAILIDDENKARQLLNAMLKDLCPDVEVVALCENLHSGITAIRKYKPDLVFLDIEMPGYSGLQLLDFLEDEECCFDIIFVTAYSEYAIKAFRLEAVDYLLKPVDTDELTAAVNRSITNSKKDFIRYKQLKQRFEPETNERLAIYQLDGIKLIELSSILFLEGDGAYTRILCRDGQEIIASRNLKYFENTLSNQNQFFRSHKSYLVNLDYVDKIQKGDKPLVKIGNKELPLSAQKLDEIQHKLSIRFKA